PWCSFLVDGGLASSRRKHDVHLLRKREAVVLDERRERCTDIGTDACDDVVTLRPLALPKSRCQRRRDELNPDPLFGRRETDGASDGLDPEADEPCGSAQLTEFPRIRE